MFYQIHPIAYMSLEFDYLNDDLPAHLIGGYTVIYSWKHKSKKLQLNINGAIMADGYMVVRNRHSYIGYSKMVMFTIIIVTLCNSQRNVTTHYNFTGL